MKIRELSKKLNSTLDIDGKYKLCIMHMYISMFMKFLTHGATQ